MKISESLKKTHGLIVSDTGWKCVGYSNCWSDYARTINTVRPLTEQELEEFEKYLDEHKDNPCGQGKPKGRQYFDKETNLNQIYFTGYLDSSD